MRKSFTRLFSLFALFCVLGLQMVYGGVIDRVPADGKTNVNPGTDLTLTFDYPLAQGADYTGAIIQLKNSGGAVVDAITLPSSRFVIDGSKITIDLQATLLDATGYYVVFPNNVVKENKPDGTSVVFAGYSASGDWNFTTGDYTAPKLATSGTFTPADGATNFGGAFSSTNALSIKTSTFTVNFNENVTGVSGKYIKIYNAAGNIHEMIDAGVYTSASTAVTFTTTNLRENSDYYILIDAGAFVDNNATASLNNKNPFAGISDKTKWNFTTRDYTPAKFATDYPAFGTVAKNTIALKVKLDEPANVYFKAYPKAISDALTSMPTVTDIGTANAIDATTAGTEYSFNYAGLTEGETYVFYYYSVNKSKLLTSDDFLTSVVAKTAEKTTLDETFPTVQAYLPTVGQGNGGTGGVDLYLDDSGASGHGTFSMEFSENVKAGAGNIILKKSSDNTIVESVDVTSSAVVFSDKDFDTDLMTVKFATKLASATKYYVTIASGVITDKSGNKYGGINTSTAWTFTTKDVDASTATFSAPASTKGVLSKEENVVITISDNIYTDASGTAATVGAAATSSVRVERNNVDVTSMFDITFTAANKITVDPKKAGASATSTEAWLQNSKYVVKLLKNKIYDRSGNVIAAEVVKSYTTDSYDVPTTTNWTTSPVLASGNITFKFSEKVELLGGGEITSDNVGSLITLTETGGIPVSFVATYSASDYKVTIDPVSDFTPGKTYTVNLSTGYQDFNLIGSAFQGLAATVPYSITDKVAPTITFDFTKTNVPTTAASANLVVKFSEGVSTVSASQVTLREGDANGTVIPVVLAASADPVYTFNPSVNLKEGTTYYLSFADQVVADANTNKNVGASTTFVTKTTPTLVSSEPADNATDVSHETSEIVLTYSENVKVNSTYTMGALMVDAAHDGATTADIAVAAYVTDGTKVIAYALKNELVFVGNTVTIPLTKTKTAGVNDEFVSETAYDVIVDGGLILSSNNNPAAAITLNKLDFTIEDFAAPVLSPISPATESLLTEAITAADKMSAPLKLTFNEKVTKGIGSIVVQRVDISGQPQQVIDVNSSNVSISTDGLTVSVDHLALMPSLTSPATVVIYEVVVSNGAIVDLAGNKFAGLIHDSSLVPTTLITTSGTNYTTAAASNKQWYFSTKVNAAPAWKPSASTPGVDADNVSTSTSLVIAFDKAITLADGAKKVTLSTSTGVAQEYRLNESNISISGNNITVTLQTLAANTEYFVSLEYGAVKDANNVVNAAINGSTSWNFNTGDANGPFATVHVDGSKNSSGAWVKVKRNSDITITFDEAIRLINNNAIGSADIPQGIVTLSSGSGFIPSYTADLSSDKKTITINASSYTGPLTSMTAYTIVVSGVEDNNDHAVESNTFTFTIDDYDAPAGVYSTLDVNQTGNGTSGAAPAGFKVIENYKGTELKVEFDYNENATVYYQLLAKTATTPTVATLIANGTAVTVNKDADPATSVVIPTAEATEYKLVVVAVDVVNATAQSLVETQIIQTADITAPTVVEYVNNGKLDVNPTTFDVSLKFAAKVQKGSGNLYVFDSNNVLIGTYAASGVTLSADAKQITQTVTGLASNKSYYVVIDKGFVKDEAVTLPSPNRYTNPATRTENLFPGFSSSSTYTFGTKDTNGPTVSSVTPHNTAAGTNVATISTAINADVNSNIVITFSENIKLGSAAGAGDIEIWKAGTSNLQELILATSSQVTISGKVMTINPSIDFGDGLSDITVNVKDGVVADLAGNDASAFAWKFNVKDLAAPTVSFLSSITTDPIDEAPVALATMIQIEFSEAVKLLDESAFITDDLDTLVTFVDGANKAVAFRTIYGGTDNFTVEPIGGLKSNTDYTISFGQVFMDAAKNQVPAQTVNFTTSLTNSPSVMFDPANETNDVAAAKTITVTFERGIVQEDPTGTAATGYFSTLENSELMKYFVLRNAAGEDIAVNATISSDKKVVTLDPKVDFDSESVLSLTFDPQGINVASSSPYTLSSNGAGGSIADLTDSLNNKVAVKVVDVKTPFGTNGGVVEFTVVDTKAPVLAGAKYSPNEANYLNATDKLSVQFNEKVKAGTGDIKIYRKDGTLVETITASTLTTKSDDETTILINPVKARENNTEYYVIIPSGAIVDKSSLANSFAGTVDNTSWTYSTADSQTPVVVSLSPASGSTDVYVYDNLVLTFDKKVKLGSGNIAIYKKGGDAFDLLRVSTSEYRVKMDPSQLSVTIDFTNTLAPETEYYVEVEPGTFVNAKNTNAKFAGLMANTDWTFSTEVTNAPKVIANGLTPADNSTINTDKLVLSMTFDREVMKGTGVVKLIETAAGTVVETVNIADAVVAGTNASITFLNPLKSGTDYHVIVEAGTVTNTLPSKVAYAGITSPAIWNFTTSTDITAPKLVTWTPNATTTTDNDPTYVMTFDENVVLGAGSLKIYKKSDNSLALTIPVTATMVNDKVVTVKNTYDATLNNGLDKNTDYYVLVDAGLVKDAAGNPSAAVTDVAAWTFKTADFATVIEDPINISLAFKVYPNPFVDDVTVETSFDLTKVVVTNIAGQVVKQVVNPTGTIQLNELRSGVYFMALYQGNKVAATVKIVKR